MFYEDAESAIIRDAFDLGNGRDKNTQVVLNESVFRRYFVGDVLRHALSWSTETAPLNSDDIFPRPPSERQNDD